MGKWLDKEISVPLDILMMFTLVMFIDFIHDFYPPNWLGGLLTIVFWFLFIRNLVIVIKHY